jgi:hypothetical protein
LVVVLWRQRVVLVARRFVVARRAAIDAGIAHHRSRGEVGIESLVVALDEVVPVLIEAHNSRVLPTA